MVLTFGVLGTYPRSISIFTCKLPNLYKGMGGRLKFFVNVPIWEYFFLKASLNLDLIFRFYIVLNNVKPTKLKFVIMNFPTKLTGFVVSDFLSKPRVLGL